jgi:glycosyltransferase involved in cell wall biosynthesis
VSHAFEKAIRPRSRGGVHVCYCLSPPRYLWDMSRAHDRMAGPLQRMALRAARGPLRALDRRLARNVHHFVSLSRHVAGRVKRAYGRDSAVVYPPVALKPASAAHERESFLFTMGRLVPYKRVDLAIGAAEKLGMRLVVAGDGPERARLQRIAGPNTQFLGAISETEAGKLLSTCRAFVFCAEEDFGIAPLEANAHGAPVVAYGAGAALETIRDGESGVFFHEQTSDSLAAAVRHCLDRRWDEAALRANAGRFTPERFDAGMRDALLSAVQGAHS